MHGRKIAVIGLGYVGLPVAVSFARGGSAVVGFDIDASRVAELREGRDRTNEIDPAELKNPKLSITSDAADLKAAMASGQLKPPPTGTAMYMLMGKTEASARGMWVVLVPNMTAEATGLPTQPTEKGTPWLMRAGTPAAHIHIPQP